MRKPECVFSEPVRVSTDELLTELLRRLPEDQVTAALAAACDNAQRRTTVKRHIRYKCQRFFRRLTERFGTVPDELAVAVGLQGPQLQLQLPTTAPEEVAAPVEPQAEPSEALNEYELALERFAPLEANPQDPTEEFLKAFDVPGFDDFKSVFESYPYVKVVSRPGYDQLLVLGYASATNSKGQLVRRNLAVNEVMFNDLTSIFGHLRRKNGDIHQHIKVLTYRPGTLIRCWTNVRDVGDRLDQSRFLHLSPEGLQLITASAYHKMLKGSD